MPGASGDDGEDVAGGEDEVLLAGVLDLGAAVLAVDDLVADGDVERDALVAVLVEPARADRDDLALLGLLLRGVRDNQTRGRRLLGVEGLDEDAVLERLDVDRHLSTSPICVFVRLGDEICVSTLVSTPALRVLNRTYARPSTRSSRVPALSIGTMRGVDLEAFGWLLTVEGQAALGEASRLLERSDLIAVGERLRRRIAPEQAAVVTSQVTLRRAALPKFGDLANRLYFTADGLEQATRPEVGRHRAQRMAAAGPTRLADLCCGIGADLMAFAQGGLTPAGFDLDPVRVAVARANLAALDLSGTAEQADVTAMDLTPFDVVFADPARRKARGRVFDPDDYAPSWSFVERLLLRPSCVKAAPGLAHDRVPNGVEAEWVSWRGGVKEVALWSAHLASARRRATVMSPEGSSTMTDADSTDSVEVRAPGRYLLEPDGAVIRAGLVAGVAAQVDGWLVDEHI